MTVYPNPTSGVVKIEAEGIERVSVYNVLGEKVFEAESTGNIDLSAYGYGVYLIKVETRDGVMVRKVRVE